MEAIQPRATRTTALQEEPDQIPQENALSNICNISRKALIFFAMVSIVSMTLIYKMISFVYSKIADLVTHLYKKHQKEQLLRR